MVDINYGLDADEILEFMGVDLSEEDDEDEVLEKVLNENMKNNLEKTALFILFKNARDGLDNGYGAWDARHRENYSLNMIYDYLVKLGYQISDEEQALRDGTHELFEVSND